jgi:hypothetical protein
MVAITKKRSRSVYSFIVLFCIASFFFYRPAFIDLRILKVVYGALLMWLVFKTFGKSPKGSPKVKNGKLTLAVKLIVFAILFSVLPAYESWQQSIPVTLIVTLPYLSYMLYFYLRKKQVSREVLERVIYVIGITCLVCYFIAFAAFPIIVFGQHTADEINVDRGFARIIIGGLGFIYLLYFLALNTYLTKRKTKWLLVTFFCFVGIVMTLTRQVILASVVLSFYLIYIRLNLGSKFLIIAAVVSVGIFVVPNLKFVQLLVNQTQEQTSDFKDDIRYEEGDYYLNDFPPDGFARIFGNGEPSLGNTYYGIFVQNVEAERMLFQSDVGFIGFYSKFGLVGIFAWLMVFFIVIKNRFAPDMVYLKLFVIFILLTGLTSSMPFNDNDIASIAICFYLADGAMAAKEKKKGVLKYKYPIELEEPPLEEEPPQIQLQ